MDRQRTVVCLVVVLMLICVCERGISQNQCSYYYTPVSWWAAFWKCRNEGKELLCYASEVDTQNILNRNPEPNFPFTKLWLSKHCSSSSSEPCLTLQVKKINNKQWHYLKTSCNERQPFICCDGGHVTFSPVTTPTTRRETTTSSRRPSSSYTNPSLTSPVYTSSHQRSSSSHPVITTSSPTTVSYAVTTTAPQLTTASLSTTEDKPESTTSVTTPTTLSVPGCTSTVKRAILWPDVPLNTTVAMPCPGNSAGKAVWFCNSTTENWYPSSPDMSQCHSLELKKIKEKFENSTASETIEALDQLFQNDSESLQGRDLVDSVSLMSGLVDKLRKDLSSVPQKVQFKVAENEVSKGTSVFDKIIQLDAWSDLPPKEVSRSGSKLLITVDSYAFLLADMLVNKTRHSIVKTNIAIEVHKEDIEATVRLPTMFEGFGKHAQITLSNIYSGGFDQNGGVPSIVYACYANMSAVLLAESVGDLNSLVVGASLSMSGSKDPLPVKGKVEILLENFHLRRNTSSCVFWNTLRHGWDDSGCRVKETNDTHTLCECDHLTNFAVLTDFQGLIVDVDETVFQIITMIGCSLSIVSLAVCIIVFSCHGLKRSNAWNIRYSIHWNLCFSLFVANLILLVGLNQTQDQTVCAVIAGLLHYFFLSAFCWMLLESVHIYLLLVVVFSSKKTHRGKYCLFGYGVPLLIVGITAAVRHENYGTSKNCWLSVEHGTIWSFTGPVACILMVNFAALVLAQVKASRMSTKGDTTAMIRRWLRVTFILFPILGITWIFGFLYIGKTYEIAGYISATLNSLQGFCIFICHCVLDKKTRALIASSIRKKRKTSAQTNSTGSNKSSKKSHHTLIQSTDVSFVSRLQKSWSFFRKPWAFCFEMNLLNTQPRKSTSEQNEEQLPKVTQWKRFQDTRDSL